MSACPKCGKNLKLTDLKPTCPHCGVNLLYYKIEERLEVDAINAELEHAKTQQRIDRAKASMAGSALTIVRIVLLAVAVGMFFLPLAKMHVVGPYFDNNVTINAMEVYNKVSAMDFDGLFTLIGSPLRIGETMTFFAVSVVTIALAAVCAILELVLSFLSCSPKGFVRNVIFAALGIVFTVVSIITFNKFINGISIILPNVVEGSVQFGAFLVILGFALVLAINIIIKIKGVDVKYKQSYVDSVPYETFVEKFGVKKYTLEDLDEIKEKIAEYRIVPAEK